ncbi:MAG TPA: YgeY family selenium metabolism-linked hydrolase [Gaiellaceae bacterium]|nr:YgeY family selenium metabolism-linked hydrolase [Gaiellaceae bacterium]
MTPPAIDPDALGDFARRLVSVRSPSGEEGDLAVLVATEMERLGFTVEVDELGNVIGTVDGGPGRCVLLDAHMDTVGVTDPSAWSHDPSGEIADGRLWGRGAMDIKGPLAAAIHGAASFAAHVAGRIVVSASVAEELVEGPALAEIAKRVLPDTVVICEATSLRIARGQRGRAEVQVEVLGSPTHTARPELGVNAAEGMADVIAELRSLELPTHPVLGDAILVLTDVISRPYPGLSVVPDRCVATYDRRTLPGEDEEAVLEPVRATLERALARTGASGKTRIADDDFATYTGARLTAPNFAPAWFYDDNAPHVRTALDALREAGLPAELTHYAFCTNGSASAGRLGIPTLGYGPGDEALAHRIDEHIELAELEAGSRGYAALTAALTG